MKAADLPAFEVGAYTNLRFHHDQTLLPALGTVQEFVLKIVLWAALIFITETIQFPRRELKVLFGLRLPSFFVLLLESMSDCPEFLNSLPNIRIQMLLQLGFEMVSHERKCKLYEFAD